MGRPIRIYYPGLTYHILNRGNNRQIIFAEEADYRHYLDILKRYKEKFDFKIFAYCLMTNHIHLLLQVSDKASISKIMQAITIAHTRYYHYKYQASGHVWQGRFKSPIVSDDEYLLTVMCYIEQNPIRAGLVKDLKDYPYSSFSANTQLKIDGLVDRDENPVFAGLASTLDDRIKVYKQFATNLLDKDKVQQVRDSLIGKFHYVSEQLEQMREKLMSGKRPRGRPRKRQN